MITNKDLSIDSKNGKVTLNGNKYDLGTQGEIDAAVKDVYSVMGEMGAKNLIPRPYADGEEKSQNNMKYTVNTDGTITATATQALTGDATFNLYRPTDTEELVLKAGVTYVLSGDPGSSGVERIVVVGRSAAGGTSETLIINNTGVPKEYTPDVDKVITNIYIRIYAGPSSPIPYNETFKPMLRLAADTDNTYQPYAMTNKQLTERKQDTLTFDTAPTENSTNPVTSAGIKTYADGLYVAEGKNKGSSTTITAGNFVRVDIPCTKQGYTPFGILSVQGAATAGAVSLMEFGFSSDASQIYVYYANNTSADKTLTDVKVRVLYRKN